MTKKLLFSLGLLLVSCVFAYAQKGRVYVADNFDGIKFALPVELNISIGSKFEVKAVGAAEDIDWIVVEKNGSSLNIKSKSKHGHHRFDRGTKVYVTLPRLEELSLAGSGDIYVKGDVKGGALQVNVAGSGDIAVEKVSVDIFGVNVSGSGNVKITDRSSANRAEYKIAGSGSVSSRNVMAKSVVVNVAGSGDINAYASENLSVKIAGSGNVECFGNPKNVEKVKFGSGSISIK
ncbi:head GIN domain-containing protein [uncultured Acetobacteroides sp.]|uniref:head GIN domain-containing protein n=1 Tax=uncultured Acetobacteroides sp. TaxID=1760811 RepID=UPI0029F45854|nr:head GIN domain-containing protein [uncultured Acetobacteroides sp.]